MRYRLTLIVISGTLLTALAGCGSNDRRTWTNRTRPPRAATPSFPPVPGSTGTGPEVAMALDTRPTPAEKAARKLKVKERRAGGWIDTGEGGPGGSPAKGSIAVDRFSASEGGSGPRAPGGAPAATVAPPSSPPMRTSRAKTMPVPAGPSTAAPSRPESSPPQDAGNPPAEALQAGEVDDNKLFAKYLDYLKKYTAGGGVRQWDAAERYRIRVVNKSGVGVPDAQVVLSAPDRQNMGPLYRARTTTAGDAMFFPAAIDAKVPDTLQVTVRKGDLTGSQTVTRQKGGGVWTVQLAEAPDSYTGMTLDLLFLVDTTGSMSEEIDRVRDTIRSVSAQIKALPARPRLRLGLVLYRDRGDTYVTRRRPFTTDVNAFQAALKDVSADGGGDTPEDLNAGVQQAVEAMDWSPSDAARIMFVIADAPPHMDYEQEYDYFLGAQRAAEKGIKVFGVSTVGTNDVGEFVFRQMALLTLGRFVFVTRGSDGGTPHHVDRQDYSVQRLDNLIVRLVSEEFAALGRRG